jgi:hypothetical protein
MTDAICAPEEKEKRRRRKFRKLYNINCVICCDFLYELLLAEAVALFSCCFPSTFSPPI